MKTVASATLLVGCLIVSGIGFDKAVGIAQAQVVKTQARDSQHVIEQGDALLDKGEFLLAQAQYRRALALARQQGDALAEAEGLYKIGLSYRYLEDRDRTAAFYDESLTVLDRLSTPAALDLRSEVLFNAAIFDFYSPERVLAVERLAQIVDLATGFEVDPPILGRTFFLLGVAQEDRGAFAIAIERYQQAADIFQTIVDVEYYTYALVSTGNVWGRLGDLDQAGQLYQQALVANADLDSPNWLSYVWDNLGILAAVQGDYAEALSFYQQALQLKESFNDSLGISHTLNNIGDAYLQQGNTQQALTVLSRGIAISDSVDDFDARANIRDTLGMVHAREQQYEMAWVRYHQSLRLSEAAQDRRRIIVTTLNLAQLAQLAQQPTVAITFYKQAINEIEAIRTNLRTLPIEVQKRYADTVSQSYRDLAGLLLQQSRVFEAQQVLDLLKIQELDQYLQDVRADQATVAQLTYLPAERTLLDLHQTLLLNDRTELDPVLALDAFLSQPEVVATLEHLQDADALQPPSLKQLRLDLQALPSPAVILYPLVLEDRLELLLITPEGPPLHRTIPVTKALLQAKVSALRQQLGSPAGTVKPDASQLYDWIVRPFEAALAEQGIENIIYVPDSVLHYIPLSVFRDRDRNEWLVEQYTSHNLTASSVGELGQRPATPFKVLAGAFTDAQTQPVSVPIGEASLSFYGLTYAGQEVDFLQDTLPTVVLRDQDFTRRRLQTQLQGQNIVHLATHAAFVPGRPEDSFILLGDGDSMTLAELADWSLPGVELVVLSACQTGIGHIEDGLEILGMGFQIQRTEALAALASFWNVNDRSAARLMQQFYTGLANDQTKVAALRQAQLDLIAQGWSQPYHWAPFVVIGNGQ
ncbi:MAG: CHAT domain-containing protein [Cyanobacteria bacterium J06628_6]